MTKRKDWEVVLDNAAGVRSLSINCIAACCGRDAMEILEEMRNSKNSFRINNCYQVKVPVIRMYGPSWGLYNSSYGIDQYWTTEIKKFYEKRPKKSLGFTRTGQAILKSPFQLSDKKLAERIFNALKKAGYNPIFSIPEKPPVPVDTVLVQIRKMSPEGRKELLTKLKEIVKDTPKSEYKKVVPLQKKPCVLKPKTVQSHINKKIKAAKAKPKKVK